MRVHFLCQLLSATHTCWPYIARIRILQTQRYGWIHPSVTSFSDYARLSHSDFRMKLCSNRGKHATRGTCSRLRTVDVSLTVPCCTMVLFFPPQDPDNHSKAGKIACSIEESAKRACRVADTTEQREEAKIEG